MKQDLMKGIIDMHVHTNPDLRLRAYDDFELMEAAIRVGARAIVIKTHQGTTMDRAYLCNRCLLYTSSRANYLGLECSWLSSVASYKTAELEYTKAVENYEWAVRGLIVSK